MAAKYSAAFTPFMSSKFQSKERKLPTMLVMASRRSSPTACARGIAGLCKRHGPALRQGVR